MVMPCNAGLLGRVLGAPQLGHVAAEAAFKCHLFRKSAMSQRLILRGLRSATLRHAEKAEAPDMYRASFASSAKDEQVSQRCPCCFPLHPHATQENAPQMHARMLMAGRRSRAWR